MRDDIKTIQMISCHKRMLECGYACTEVWAFEKKLWVSVRPKKTKSSNYQLKNDFLKQWEKYLLFKLVVAIKRWANTGCLKGNG